MGPEVAARLAGGPGPRVLALCLPDLPLQRIRRGRAGASRPLAVLHEGRVALCDAAARARGVGPGDSAVQAEAACAGIELLPLDPAADGEALQALAEAMLQLAPAVELAPPDALLLDASAAHLAIGPGRAGRETAESALLARATALAAALGYRCRAALCTGKGPARALARAGRGGGRPVPPEATAAALAPLPLAALPEIPADLAARLAGLGIAEVGGLSRLPAETLAQRFGLFAAALVRLARGEDPSPLAPFEPRRLPEEGVELEVPVESAEPLLFSLKTVADRLSARLAGRGLGATRLDLTLRLDPRGEARLEIPLARPSAAASRWLLVLRERVAALALEAPVAGLRLGVGEAAAAPAEQLGLSERPESLQALETVLSRLSARLGEGALFAAEPADRHRPEGAYRARPFAPVERRGPAARGAETATRNRRERRIRALETANGLEPASPSPGELPRPTRLLPVPLPLLALGEGGRLSAVRCQGRTCRVLSLSPPERLAGEWWGEPFERDYHRARLEGLGECWIYRDRVGGRLWLHGFFD